MFFFSLFALITIHAHVSAQEIIEGPPGEHGSEYILIREELTFLQAYTRCAALGANLVTAKSRDQADFFWQQRGPHLIFVRAKVEQENGRCVARWLVDGSELANHWDSNWDTCDGDKKCVTVGPINRWFMMGCSEPHNPVLCQRETMTLALASNERKQEENMRRTEVMLDKNDKKSDTLSENVELLIGLMKKMSIEFNEYKKRVDDFLIG